MAKLMESQALKIVRAADETGWIWCGSSWSAPLAIMFEPLCADGFLKRAKRDGWCGLQVTEKCRKAVLQIAGRRALDDRE